MTPENPTTGDLIYQARRALAVCTPGPWHMVVDDTGEVEGVMGADGMWVYRYDANYGTDQQWSDARFAVFVRYWLPVIIDRLEQLQEVTDATT